MTGNEIIAQCLLRHGVEDIFYLVGGPMIDLQEACVDGGVRMVDVRHEQAAAMMAHAYTRVARKPAVCMACSGPGTTNLITGIVNAFADCAPVIALGGSSPIRDAGRGAFQEIDQVALMRPITRWADRCLDARELPEFIDMAFARAFGSRPGPVYLDLPGDVLYQRVPDDEISWGAGPLPRVRPLGHEAAIERAVEVLTAAERPVLISGSGVLWSEAEAELERFVDSFGIPFYSTPQGRGAIREDHALSFLGARSAAFRDADVIVSVGTRQTYVTSYMEPPRWNGQAKLIQIDIDPSEIGRNRRPAVGVVGDAKAILSQLVAAGEQAGARPRSQAWCRQLGEISEPKLAAQEERMASDVEPIHPLRLCREVRDLLPEDAILCVDGQEILHYARQSIPFLSPNSLNSGPMGCMGVGVPFAIGAKVAAPDKTVVVLHGDGSFGFNAMELDTAIRHDIPFVCVISNNGSWAAFQDKPGQRLGLTRYDEMFRPLGCHTEHVERAADIRPALERALASGKPAVVNVVTDDSARAGGATFTPYET